MHRYATGRHVNLDLEKLKKLLGKRRMAIVEEMELEPDGVEIVLFEQYRDETGASLTIIEVSDCDNQAHLLEVAKDFIDSALYNANQD